MSVATVNKCYSNFPKTANLRFVHGGTINQYITEATPPTLLTDTALLLEELRISENKPELDLFENTDVVDDFSSSKSSTSSEFSSSSSVVQKENPFKVQSNSEESESDTEIIIQPVYKSYIDTQLELNHLYHVNKTAVFESIFEEIPAKQNDEMTTYFNIVYPLFMAKQYVYTDMSKEEIISFIKTRLLAFPNLYALPRKDAIALKHTLTQGEMIPEYGLLYKEAADTQLNLKFPLESIKSQEQAIEYTLTCFFDFNKSDATYTIFINQLNKVVPKEYIQSCLKVLNDEWFKSFTLEEIVNNKTMPVFGSVEEYAAIVEEIYNAYIINNEIKRKGLKRKKQRRMNEILNLLKTKIPEHIYVALMHMDDEIDLVVDFYSNGNLNKHKLKDFMIRFIECDKQEISLPPMSKGDRKHAHSLGNQLGLKTKSKGKGTKRFLCLYKTKETRRGLKVAPDYEEKKVSSENIGYGLLMKMGWEPKEKDIEPVKLEKRHHKKGLRTEK